MKVKIKTWDDMEKEFGLDSSGHINCCPAFVPDMEDIMPPDRILELDDNGCDGAGWEYIDEMIDEKYSTSIDDALTEAHKDEGYEDLVKASADADEGVAAQPAHKRFTEMSDEERKKVPVYDGFIRYFPNAIIAVAQNSAKGQQQHNPGKPLFWDRSKSKDEAGSLTRHLLDQALHQNASNPEAVIEAAQAKAWRAMADLEKLLEDYFEATPTPKDTPMDTPPASRSRIVECTSDGDQSDPELVVGARYYTCGDDDNGCIQLEGLSDLFYPKDWFKDYFDNQGG